jgi:hypothetical protein
MVFSASAPSPEFIRYSRNNLELFQLRRDRDEWIDTPGHDHSKELAARCRNCCNAAARAGQSPAIAT